MTPTIVKAETIQSSLSNQTLPFYLVQQKQSTSLFVFLHTVLAELVDG
jgi:hypothetical protein